MISIYSTCLEKYELFQMIEKLKDSDIKILIYLFKKKRAPIAWIVDDNNMSFGTVYRSMNTLFKLHLIEEEKEGNKRLLKLSPLGEKVVKKLLEIDLLIKDALGIRDNSISSEVVSHLKEQ